MDSRSFTYDRLFLKLTALQNQTDKNLLVCYQCGMTFCRSDALREHRKIHDYEKPFVCSLCDKSFSQSHENTHGREALHMSAVWKGIHRPFNFINSPSNPYTCPDTCPQCDKVFTTSSNFRTHLKVHTGEKPYKCTQCDKTLKYSSDLVRHRREHSEILLFSCSQCDMTFKQAYNLRRHTKNHTGEKLHKCPQCEKKLI